VKLVLDLDDATLDALAGVVAARRPAEPQAPTRYVTRAEAVAMGIELKVLRRAEKSGELEAFQPGRKVIYRLGDIVALVERHKVLVDGSGAQAESAEVVPLDPFERAMARADRRLASR
jgi:hypothetical protein